MIRLTRIAFLQEMETKRIKVTQAKNDPRLAELNFDRFDNNNHTYIKGYRAFSLLFTEIDRLDVNGDINTSGNIRQSGGSYNFPDYVFETYFEGISEFNLNYRMKDLSEVETFIKENNHLPGVQSREDVQNNGWIVTENVRTNLEKIEELFLHTIKLDKKVTKLQLDKVSLIELIEIQKEQIQKQNLLINSILKRIEENN